MVNEQRKAQFSEFVLALLLKQPQRNIPRFESLPAFKGIQISANLPDRGPWRTARATRLCPSTRERSWEDPYPRKSKQLNIVDEKWKWNKDWKNMLMEKYESSSQQCDGPTELDAKAKQILSGVGAVRRRQQQRTGFLWKNWKCS